MNLYAQLAAVKSDMKVSGSSGDTALLRLLGSISRAVDDVSHRRFYSEVATKYLDGNGRKQLWLGENNDLISVTSLQVDKDGDGVYETTLAANTDYWLWPDNETPKLRIDLNPQGTLLSLFPIGRKRVKIAGLFGYSNDTELVTTVNDEGGGADATETAITLATGGGALLSVGETIVVESEQMYISAIVTDTLTVVRAINGTTGAAHTNGTNVSRRRYPEPVEQAVSMQAVRFLRENQTGNSGEDGASAIGGFSFRAMYPAIRDLLAPYMIPVVV